MSQQQIDVIIFRLQCISQFS